MAEHPNHKFRAGKPVSQKTGPTFTENDPAKFRSAGKMSGKTGVNDVQSQKEGATFTENSTHIPSMNPSTHGEEKSKGEHAEKDFNPHGRKPSGSDNPVVTTPPYPLEHEYRK